MSVPQGPTGESPTVIRDRAVAVADYLLAVRAQLERPSRTVPATDAHWLDALPEHPDCQVGPTAVDASWLRVGLPPIPPPIAVPAELRRRLTTVTSVDEPKIDESDPEFAGADETVGDLGEDTRTMFERWRDEQWRPWAAAVEAAEQTRALHRGLFDLMHRLDMNAATTELVWGHGILTTVAGEHRVRYPLVTTPVTIEYEPDKSLITVSPQGPARLQTGPLSGLDERYLAQLIDLTGPGGALDVDLWD
jgi:hypothetical protein